MLPSPPRSPLFPYTTLFRSLRQPAGIDPLGQVGVIAANEEQGFAVRPTHQAMRSMLAAAGQRPQLLDMAIADRSEEHTSELQSHVNLVCRLLLEKKKTYHIY